MNKFNIYIDGVLVRTVRMMSKDPKYIYCSGANVSVKVNTIIGSLISKNTYNAFCEVI